MGHDEFIVTSETGKKLIEWANNGIDELKIPLEDLLLCTTEEGVKDVWINNPSLHSNKQFINAVTNKKNECNLNTNNSATN